MSLKTIRILSIIMSVLMMSLIFGFSAEDAEKSSDTSSDFIVGVAQTFYKDFDEMTDDEKDTLISEFQFSVRKLAHFSIFTLLGFFVMIFALTYPRFKIYHRMIYSLIFCAFYAASDEVHQLFVNGRSCEFRDFCIDFGGSALGVLFVFLIYFIFLKVKRRNSNAEEKVN